MYFTLSLLSAVALGIEPQSNSDPELRQAEVMSLRPKQTIKVDGIQYELIEDLGRGSFGRTFRAKEISTGQEGALKLWFGKVFQGTGIPDHMDPSAHLDNPMYQQYLDLETLRDKGVNVPEVYSRPASVRRGNHLFMQEIEGPTLSSLFERRLSPQHQRAYVRFLHSFEKAKQYPLLRNLVGNTKLAPDGEFYLYDPDALQYVPTDSMIDLAPKRERGALTVYRFEEILHDKKRAIVLDKLHRQGPPVYPNQRVNPYWIDEYLAMPETWAHHQPSAELFKAVDWRRVKPEDQPKMRKRLQVHADKWLSAARKRRSPFSWEGPHKTLRAALALPWVNKEQVVAEAALQFPRGVFLEFLKGADLPAERTLTPTEKLLVYGSLSDELSLPRSVQKWLRRAPELSVLEAQQLAERLGKWVDPEVTRLRPYLAQLEEVQDAQYGWTLAQQRFIDHQISRGVHHLKTPNELQKIVSFLDRSKFDEGVFRKPHGPIKEPIDLLGGVFTKLLQARAAGAPGADELLERIGHIWHRVGALPFPSFVANYGDDFNAPHRRVLALRLMGEYSKPEPEITAILHKGFRSKYPEVREAAIAARERMTARGYPGLDEPGLPSLGCTARRFFRRVIRPLRRNP